MTPARSSFVAIADGLSPCVTSTLTGSADTATAPVDAELSFTAKSAARLLITQVAPASKTKMPTMAKLNRSIRTETSIRSGEVGEAPQASGYQGTIGG